MKTKNVMKGAVVASLLAAGVAFFLNKTLSKETKTSAKKSVTALTKSIMERLKTLKSMTKVNFETVVDAAIDEYAEAKKMSKETTKELRRELKSQWKSIESEVKDVKVSKLLPKKRS